MNLRHVLPLAGLAVCVSCLGVSDPGTGNAQIRVVNASEQSLNIFLDSRLVVDQSQQLNVSLIIAPAAQHQLTVRTANGVETPLDITTTPGGNFNVYAVTSPSGAVTLALLDSTATPASGSAKLRAINLSTLGQAIDIYASQPSGAAGTLLAPSFDYLTLTPYVQKPAGAWEVYITSAGTSAKLNTTGAFSIEDGGRRTVVVIDSANMAVFRVLPE